MIGNFKIKKFISDKLVTAELSQNSDVVVRLYLMPLNRKDTSAIAEGDSVFAVVDDTSGYGVILMNFTHDFGHKFDYDIDVKGAITATKDISTNADVKAGAYTLRGHTHDFTTTATAVALETPFTVAGTTMAPEVI